MSSTSTDAINETKAVEPGEFVEAHPLIRKLYEKHRAKVGLGQEQIAATLVLAEMQLMQVKATEDLKKATEKLSSTVEHLRFDVNFEMGKRV